MSDSDEIIEKLKMISHPEGGYFKESYRNENVSLIYYLLKKNEKSHWHRLTKNEILHFYDGDPLKLLISKNGKNIKEIILNNKNNNGQIFHYIVKAGTWFSMESQGEYSLIGCTVAPPFDYDDFELAPKKWKPGKS